MWSSDDVILHAVTYRGIRAVGFGAVDIAFGLSLLALAFLGPRAIDARTKRSSFLALPRWQANLLIGATVVLCGSVAVLYRWCILVRRGLSENDRKQASLHRGFRRRAVFAFWRRVTGWPHLLAIAFLIVCFALHRWSGHRSWWVGAFCAFLILVVGITTLIYVVHLRSSLSRFRQMRSPEATLVLGENRFSLSSDIGASEMEWRAITEIWRFPDFWLVFFSRSQFVTIPTGDLNDAAQDFIITNATANGAKVS